MGFKSNKHLKSASIILCVLLLATLSGCSGSPATNKESDAMSAAAGETSAVSSTEASPAVGGHIYLYGEQHGVDKIFEKEFELWKDYYTSQNMRHLFLEFPCYTAEFLNLWMQSDDDTLLNEIYDDWEGTASHEPGVKTFLQNIKRECPQTIFHGTDVGHQYATTGARYLEYLKENGAADSESYKLAQTVIEQGKVYYEKADDAYRENQMAENFKAQFELLDNESVMGIYGSMHIGLDAMDATGTVPSMANQLKKIYGDDISSEDLSWMAKDIEPLKTETININGKDYEASYFGEQDLTGFNDFKLRKFWRLENAYDDFKDAPKIGDVLPYDNYPMLIENGQVFVIAYEKTDGSTMTSYYRSDGNEWQGREATEGFAVSD